MTKKIENIIHTESEQKYNMLYNGDDIQLATICLKNNLLNKYPIQSLCLNCSVKSDFLNICLIEIKEEYRRQGFGTKVLEEISDFCDKHKLKSFIKPDSSFGTDIDALIKLYRKFGFDKIKGVANNTMIRKPHIFTKLNHGVI